jgi:hypothetical protein
MTVQAGFAFEIKGRFFNRNFNAKKITGYEAISGLFKNTFIIA